MRELEEILEKVTRFVITDGAQGIMKGQAKAAIIKLFVSKLPEKKGMLCEFDPRLAIPERDKAERNSWNAAIDQAKENFGGSK